MKELTLTNTERLYHLGLDCSRGRGGTKINEAEAQHYFLQAARSGHAGAQFRLAVRYEFGIGLAKRNIDVKAAVLWYDKAARGGYPHAAAGVENKYDSKQNMHGQVVQASAARHTGDVEFDLAICHAFGVMGEDVDYAEAARWYLKAAKLGNCQAMVHLGLCHAKGQGVPQSYSKAFDFFKKAAEMGNASARYNVGFCYDKGRGVKKNEKKAAVWYAKAAEQGDADAEFCLGVCSQEGRGVEKNEELALELYRRAAEQGQKNAVTNLSLWQMAHEVFREAGDLLGVEERVGIEWNRE